MNTKRKNESKCIFTVQKYQKIQSKVEIFHTNEK